MCAWWSLIVENQLLGDACTSGQLGFSAPTLGTISHVHIRIHVFRFLLAFPQSMLETEVCIEVLPGFERHYDGKSHVLNLKRSMRVLKQRNFNFHKKLSEASQAK